MFTAAEYRTAAAVLFEHGGPAAWVSKLEALFDRAEAIQEFTLELGFIGNADPPIIRGPKLMVWLQQQGWTPPEGLL